MLSWTISECSRFPLEVACKIVVVVRFDWKYSGCAGCNLTQTIHGSTYTQHQPMSICHGHCNQ